MKLSGVHKHISNILSNPRVLGPAVFVAIGASKTVKDYKKAEPEYKTNVLLRDSSILAGSLAAFTVVNPLTRMFCNTEFIGSMVKWLQRIVSKHNKNLADNNALKATKNIMQKTERVCKEAISGTINTFAGIAGAVVSNELMDKFVFSRPPFLVEQKDTKYTLPSEIPGFIQPVNQIFEKFSEDYFRKLEYDTIKMICTGKRKIISIGGGAFENPDNRATLLNFGKVFYLKSDLDILYYRIAKDSTRPLLQRENPKKVLENLLKKREENYQKAHHIIDTSTLIEDEIIRFIINEANIAS